MNTTDRLRAADARQRAQANIYWERKVLNRPATPDTVEELSSHAARHAVNARRPLGFRLRVAHAMSAAGLSLAAAGHAKLDRLERLERLEGNR